MAVDLSQINKLLRESFQNPACIFRRGLTLKRITIFFTPKKYFCELKKDFGGVSCWNPGDLYQHFVMDNLYMDL